MTMQIKPMNTYNAASNGTRTLEEAVSEVQREIEVRRRLYDRWVSEGKLSRVDAHDRLERLLTTLRFLLSLPADAVPAETPF
jgi:hypothetical protein